MDDEPDDAPYVPLTDEELRLRCLELAHENDRAGRSKDELLSRALAFEAYVRGTL